METVINMVWIKGIYWEVETLMKDSPLAEQTEAHNKWEFFWIVVIWAKFWDSFLTPRSHLIHPHEIFHMILPFGYSPADN